MTSMRSRAAVPTLFQVLILEARVKLPRDSLIRTIFVPTSRA